MRTDRSRRKRFATAIVDGSVGGCAVAVSCTTSMVAVAAEQCHRNLNNAMCWCTAVRRIAPSGLRRCRRQGATERYRQSAIHRWKQYSLHIICRSIGFIENMLACLCGVGMRHAPKTSSCTNNPTAQLSRSVSRKETLPVHSSPT